VSTRKGRAVPSTRMDRGIAETVLGQASGDIHGSLADAHTTADALKIIAIGTR